MKNSAFLKLASEDDSEYVDLYVTYGVSFIKGTYFELLKRSASKGYVGNESRLQHGTRLLAKPKYAKYDKRKVSVQLFMEADNAAQYVDRFEAFQDKISSGMFYLKIPSRHRVFKLVYSDIKNGKDYNGSFATFTLELEEPNPYDRDVIANV